MPTFDASLSLPEGWFLAQPDPALPELSIPAQVNAHLKHRRDLRRYRQLIIDAVSSYGRSCSAAGAAQSAVRWDLTRDKRQDPLFAYMEIERFDEDFNGPLDERLTRWHKTLDEGDPQDEVPPRTAIVDLDAGPAVRREFVRPVGSDNVLRLVVEFWLPVDDTDTIFNLQFSTSNLAAASVMVPEFDFIACRLSLDPPE
jgi:hypothetical protein